MGLSLMKAQVEHLGTSGGVLVFGFAQPKVAADKATVEGIGRPRWHLKLNQHRLTR